MIVTARQGDTLDAICWRELGATAAVLEQAYLLNQNMADVGPVLAEGTIVTLPDAPLASASLETVNLWD